MAEPRAERRLVTCVFIDVVGSTELTVRLGPERMQRSLADAFNAISAVAATHGGTVEKFIGDAVFVLFGAPTAHADDPARALRTADECVTALAGSSSLGIRVGIETGEALVDLHGVTDRQRMAVGTCVNVAARLQQEAEPGQILFGPTCRAATSDVAAFDDLGTRTLKGVGAVPIARLRALTQSRAKALPFVGRREELARLQSAFARAEAGHATLVLVSGEPGIGKSRLVQEFVDSIGGAVVLRARCRPGTEVGADTPLRQLLAGSDAKELPAALTHSAGVGIDPGLVALGPTDRRLRISAAWAEHITRVGGDGSVVIWIDDLHWAEPEVTRLMDSLTFQTARRLLVVATARPDFPAVTALRPGADRVLIELGGLDGDAAVALASSVAAEDIAGMVRAEGNPLFIVELARSREGRRGTLPVNIQAVIAARLDELSPSEHDLLQRAAVVGETFDVRSGALLSDTDPADVAGALARLAHLRYVSAVDGAYRFHHALVRDVAYGQLPVRTRMQLHARFAREGVDAADVEALAHHWWHAVGSDDAEWVWEDKTELATMRAEALQALLAAGPRLADRLAFERAVEVFERALTLTEDPHQLAQVEDAFARALQRNARGDDATEHRFRAIDLYRKAGERPPARLYADLLEVLVFNWGYFKHPLSVEDANSLLDEATAVAREQGDGVALVRLLSATGVFRQETSGLREIDAILDAAADKHPYADALWRAALVHRFAAGDIGTALGKLDTAMELGRDGAPINEPEILMWRCTARFQAGDLEGAADDADLLLERSLTLSPHTRQHGLAVSSLIHFGRGDWEAIASLARDFRELMEANPDVSWCIAGANLAGYGAVADLKAGRGMPPDIASVLDRVLRDAPMVRAAALLPAVAIGGAPADDDAARGAYSEGTRLYDRETVWDDGGMHLVIADVVRGRWASAESHLGRLDALAEKGGAFAGALAAAIREEVEAARGGPAATHRALNALGYSGVSELLSLKVAAVAV